MCGIAGISLPQSRSIEKNQLRLLANDMVHRGPDAEGFFLSEDRRVGLSHKRLKIIDLHSGNQPMKNEDSSKVLVFNGEIYNYRKLRQNLLANGHKFKSKSDTEVIVHLYEEYGTECLQHLRGMFAFAIYDAEKEMIFAAVDRMGKKPLFYSAINGSFYFASTFNALTKISEIPRELDPVAFDEFLSLTYIPAPRTIFSAIKKLRSGHFITWKEGSVSVKRYWDIHIGKKTNVSMEEAKYLVKQKLEEAVKIRLMSDVPLGAFLSGGIDSSTIVALASKHMSGPLDTFSIGFPHMSLNELPYASIVASQFKTNHHEFMVTPMDVEEILPQIARHFGEPYGDFSALPMWRLSEETKKYVTVALSGDGGDELFGGYGRHRLFMLYEGIGRLLPKMMISANSRFLGLPKSKNAIVRRLQRLAQIVNQPPGRIFCDLNTFMKPWEKEAAYTTEIKSALSSSVCDQFETLFNKLEGSNLDRILYIDAVTYEVCQLTKVDVMSMAWSLEARCPFVDHELAEMVFGLPDKLKAKINCGKILMKEIAKDLLPEEITRRPKQGFTVPLKYWFKDELRNYAKKTILNGKIMEVGWLKGQFLDETLQKHFDGNIDCTYKIWNLLVLSEWLKNCL